MLERLTELMLSKVFVVEIGGDVYRFNQFCECLKNNQMILPQWGGTDMFLNDEI